MAKSFLRTGGILTVGTSFAALAFMSVAAPASAAPATRAEQCTPEPTRYNLVKHDEVSHVDKVKIPGEAEVSHLEQRWRRDIPGEQAIVHQESPFYRVIPGSAEVSHQQWKYSRFAKGSDERSHNEYQFSRQNPGQDKQSHQEFKYQQQQTQYQFRTRTERPDNTVERKFTYGYDFISGGTVQFRNQAGQQVTVSGHWVQSAGWHQIPDSVINAYWGSGGVDHNLLGGSASNPKGSVPLSVYGDTHGWTATYYASEETIEGGFTEWGPWSDWTTTNPGGANSVRDVASKVVTFDYNNGNWTTDVNPNGWTKVDEREVVDRQYVAPFTEYRKADGTASANQAEAGWFTQSSFNGWSQFGQPKKVIDQTSTPDQTFYLVRDSQDNLSESTTKANASWFTAATDDSVDVARWTKIDEEKVIDQTAVPNKTVYLTKDAQGSLGETADFSKATWFNTVDTSVDLVIWKQMVDEFGDPLTRTVVDKAAVPGYTEFYVPNGGTPTRVLGPSNWTVDEPAKWVFVDNRKVIDKEVVPDRFVDVKVIDKAAWEENVAIPGDTQLCTLAYTGSGSSPDTVMFSAIGLLGVGIGAGAMVIDQKRRRRHAAE